MKNVKGNIFKAIGGVDCICITTNGIVKANGECVMGAGIALTAKQCWHGIDRILGKLIKQNGNHCHMIIEDEGTCIASFPTKNDYRNNSNIELIKQSCIEISAIATEHNWKTVLIPRPGCSNGKLNYKDVEPVISELLDDRFFIVTL